MNKIFTGLIILSLITQIIFSFFYSSQILTQNSQLDQIQTQLNQSSLKLEQLQKQEADLSSIKHLNQSTPSATLQFMKQSINLNQ